MVESLDQFVTSFNRSIRVECREDRLTGDAGAIPIREVMDRTGVTRELASRLLDPRDSARVRYSLETLLRERVSLLCQGWFDQDDADRLRRDPAFRAWRSKPAVKGRRRSPASRRACSRLAEAIRSENAWAYCEASTRMARERAASGIAPGAASRAPRRNDIRSTGSSTSVPSSSCRKPTSRRSYGRRLDSGFERRSPVPASSSSTERRPKWKK